MQRQQQKGKQEQELKTNSEAWRNKFIDTTNINPDDYIEWQKQIQLQRARIRQMRIDFKEKNKKKEKK